MKRRIFLLLSLSLLLSLLSACRDSAAPDSASAAGALPSASACPEPERTEPVPTPEPAAGMELLKNTLLDCCSDELAELGDYHVTMFQDVEDFPRMVEDTYGVAADLMTDGFIIGGTGDSLFELVVLRMTDKDSALKSMEIFGDYGIGVRNTFLEWNDEFGLFMLPAEGTASYASFTYVRTHTVSGARNEFSFFMLCQNPQEAMEALNLSINSLLSAELSQEQSQPENQPTEITEDLFFLDISSPKVEGEPDPDHSGRARYIQPNKEDMSVYDTSAIAAAWASGNPDQLSAYDRAIYDSARNVLGSMIQDGMDDFSKEAAIYEWVLQNVEYDQSQTDVMMETARESFTPYGGLINHRAICLGYATTFQLLMELAGVECITVVGAAVSSEEDHAWNMVRLNGEWYCVDASWDWPYRDDRVMDGRVLRYFNVTSDYMARTNHQWDYDNVPEATVGDHGCS